MLQKNQLNNIRPCPVCGHIVFPEEMDSQDICEFCFWQDDEVSLDYPDKAMGPNHVSLEIAQENYKKIGAVEERVLPYVVKKHPKY